MDANVATPAKRVRRAPRDRLPDTPSPVDIAMVSAASGKPIPDLARRVLEEHAELIYAQRNEIRLKHVGNVVRAMLWTLVAIVALGLFVVLGTAVFRAVRTDALVVESFRVPPALVEQGLTGEVIAKQVLDKVAEFQAKTESSRAASSYDNNWGDDLKIEIPNTGATAEQLWSLLRAWLGNETRISGEIVQTPQGISLTARIGAASGRRFTSEERNLDELVTEAAEHIMRESQPYRFAVYSARVTKNRADRVSVLQQLTRHPSAAERKWAFNGLAVVAGDEGRPVQRQAWARRALAIDPKMFPAWLNLAFAAADLGHDQEAADVLARSLKFQPGDEYDPQNVSANKCLNRGYLGMFISDAVALSAAARCAQDSTGQATDWVLYFRTLASLYRHDIQAAQTFTQPATTSLPQLFANINTAELRLHAEMERAGSPALASALQAYRAATGALMSSRESMSYHRGIVTANDRPLEARALLLLGRVDEAAAIISGTPGDCYNCVRARGMVAQAQGNYPAAQRWFATAVRQAPRLPQAYVDWGKLLIRAGRFESAMPKLARAAELSPNWADPHKYAGDVLVAQGRPAEANSKYDAALKLAPKWAELNQAKNRLTTKR